MIRKMLLAIVVSFGMLVSYAHAVRAEEGLNFKNLTSETIYIAVANYESGGWRIDGWYGVNPTQTVRVMNGRLNQRYYYYYAYNASRRSVWEGNYPFYIHPTERFTIFQVNGVYGSLPVGAIMKGFIQIDTGPYPGWTTTLY